MPSSAKTPTLWGFVSALVVALATTVSAASRVEQSPGPFGTTMDGQRVDQFVLTNTKGASVRLITYGARVTHLFVPDRSGHMGDVVLGFDTLDQYEQARPYFGCVAGRVCNRIANGKFTLDGTTYLLALNNGPNHMHGGVQGYDKRIWNAKGFMTNEGPAVRFTLHDADGTEGYPGTVAVTVIYTLTEKNALKIQYLASTDKPTPLNLTNHCYFNLQDAGVGDVLGHIVKIYADQYTPVDATLIPTGEIAPVKGTPLDFTAATAIGARVKEMPGTPPGYDHNMVLRTSTGTLAKAAEVYEPTTGRTMEVWTTQPAVHFYSGNALDGSLKGKYGAVYGAYHALCLETQHHPDAVNHPNFPSIILKPGEPFRQVTEYRFSTTTP